MKEPKVCEKWKAELMKYGKCGVPPCFVDPNRPSQTKYCNIHSAMRVKDWRRENRDLYLYDPAQAKAYRDQRPEGWSVYIQRRRAANPEKIREQNRRASAKYRARKRNQASAGLNQAVLSKDENKFTDTTAPLSLYLR